MDLLEIFKALSNRTRLEILKGLKDPAKSFPPQDEGDVLTVGVRAVLLEVGRAGRKERGACPLADINTAPGARQTSRPLPVDTRLGRRSCSGSRRRGGRRPSR